MNYFSYNLSMAPFQEEAFRVNISALTSKEDLLSAYYHKLKFPLYFGFNWDALNDCLSDLTWIAEKNIFIIHDKLPLLERSEIVTYLEILHGCCEFWERYPEEHIMKVFFPIECKSEISKILY